MKIFQQFSTTMFGLLAEGTEDRLSFTMKVLGDWKRKVREELELGGEVLVRGPYGRFDASSTDCKKQVWIAGRPNWFITIARR